MGCPDNESFNEHKVKENLYNVSIVTSKSLKSHKNTFPFTSFENILVFTECFQIVFVECN